MDRAKVVKGLDSHRIDNNHRIHCDDCPYYVDDGDHIQCVNILHDDAIALLKEQEAVEPRVSTAEQRCGHCNKVIEMDGWQSCPWCGKRIDWKGWWKKNGTRNQDS